jgi:hypothetical protein
MVLSCPDEANYAAVAKQLHETALEAEARISDLEYQLRAAANRPTIVQTTTVANTGIINGFEELIGPTFGSGWASTFNNTPLDSDEQVANNNDVFNVLGDGIYEVGFSCNVIASGVADSNSFRVVRIQQYTPDPLSLGPIQVGMSLINSAGFTSFESNVGNGVDITLIGEFRIHAGDVIFFTLLHNNTSSTLNVSIGAIGWVHKLSDLTLTAVL